jgi:hypothetical protein
MIAVLIAAAALAAPHLLQAESVFGGTADFALTTLVSPRLPGRIEPIPAVLFSPRLSVYGIQSEFELSATVGLATVHPLSLLDTPSLDLIDPSLLTLSEQVSGIPILALNELRLSLFPGDAVRVDLGHLVHNPGYGLISSPNRHFGSPGGAGLLGSLLAGAELPQAPATIIRATGFLADAYGRVILAPAPRAPAVPAVPGSWLPDLGIPATIEVPELSTEPLALDDIVVEPTERLTNGYERISVSAELGITTSRVSATAVYYHGIDSEPVARARLDLEGGPPPTRFDLNLDPLEAVIDTLGVAAETGFGPVTLWFDGALTFNKLLATSEIDSFSRRTELIRTPDLALRVGGSLQQELFVVLAEWAYTVAFTSANVLRLTIPHAALLAVQAQTRSGTFAGTLGGLITIPDFSAGILATATYRPADELELSISVPLVLAQPGSFLAPYTDLYGAQVALSYGF